MLNQKILLAKKILSYYFLIGIPILFVIQLKFNYSVFDCLYLMSISGLVGFGTNWLAIKMLFRPYQKTKIFKFQGIISKQQSQIAEEVSETIDNKNIISGEVITHYIFKNDSIYKLQKYLKNKCNVLNSDYVLKNKIVNWVVLNIEPLIPYFSDKLIEYVEDRTNALLSGEFSKENVINYINDLLSNFIEKLQNDRVLLNKICNSLINFIKNDIPEIADFIDKELSKPETNSWWGKFKSWGKNKLRKLVGYDKNYFETKIKEVIERPKILNEIKDKIIKILSKKSNFLNDPEFRKLFGKYYDKIKKVVKDWIKTKGKKRISQEIKYILNKESTWQEIDNSLTFIINKIPHFFDDIRENKYLMPKIKTYINELLSGFEVKKIIKNQIEAENPASFEKIVDEAVGKNLTMIEILGGCLGFIAGIFLFSPKIGFFVITAGLFMLGIDYLFSKKEWAVENNKEKAKLLIKILQNVAETNGDFNNLKEKIILDIVVEENKLNYDEAKSTMNQVLKSYNSLEDNIDNYKNTFNKKEKIDCQKILNFCYKVANVDDTVSKDEDLVLKKIKKRLCG